MTSPLPADEPCTICGWTGPRTQYLGPDRLAVAHPDGDHLPDWLPRLRAVSAPPTIADEAVTGVYVAGPQGAALRAALGGEA